jgi:hypothetical protein
MCYDLADIFVDTKRLEILAWVSTILYREKHGSVQNGLLEGSGLWLLNNDNFKQWKTSQWKTSPEETSPEKTLFWLHGPRETHLNPHLIAAS